MKRSKAVETMVEFYESIPEGASSYHKMDRLLSRLERLGMLPPPDDSEAVTGNIVYAYYYERVEADDEIHKFFDKPNIAKLWEPENEEE